MTTPPARPEKHSRNGNRLSVRRKIEREILIKIKRSSTLRVSRRWWMLSARYAADFQCRYKQSISYIIISLLSPSFRRAFVRPEKVVRVLYPFHSLLLIFESKNKSSTDGCSLSSSFFPYFHFTRLFCLSVLMFVFFFYFDACKKETSIFIKGFSHPFNSLLSIWERSLPCHPVWKEKKLSIFYIDRMVLRFSVTSITRFILRLLRNSIFFFFHPFLLHWTMKKRRWSNITSKKKTIRDILRPTYSTCHIKHVEWACYRRV